jgi:hypothetical protein
LSILTVHHESPNIGALMQEGTTSRPPLSLGFPVAIRPVDPQRLMCLAR